MLVEVTEKVIKQSRQHNTDHQTAAIQAEWFGQAYGCITNLSRNEHQQAIRTIKLEEEMKEMKEELAKKPKRRGKRKKPERKGRRFGRSLGRCVVESKGKRRLLLPGVTNPFFFGSG